MKKIANKTSQNALIKDIVIKIVLVLLLLDVIFIAIYYIKQLNTTEVENHSFYQYLGGQKQSYAGSIKISKNGDITELKCNDIEIELDSTPVYYSDIENTAILPEQMSIIYPKENGKTYRTTRFSICSIKDKSVYIEMSKSEKLVQNAILYDGDNLYFFIEQTKLMIGNKEYDISPLSYVYAKYNEYVEIYDKKSDTFQVVECAKKNVTASNGSYIIDLNTGSLKNGEKEQLLLKKFNSLEILK